MPTFAHQSRRQVAYAVGFAGQHPRFHLRFRRETARYERARADDSGANSDLGHGPAYVDFEWLVVFHQSGAFLVIRAKSNAGVRRIYSGASDREQGLRSDGGIVRILQSKELSSASAPHSLKDIEPGKALVFLSSMFSSPAATICACTRPGGKSDCSSNGSSSTCASGRSTCTSENAVKTQLRTAASVYVLVTTVRKRVS